MYATLSPTQSHITLLTCNELLGQFFQHLLREQAGVQLSINHFDSTATVLPESDLFFLDASHCNLEQLSQQLAALPIGTPAALVNIEPELAQPLVERHVDVHGVFYNDTPPEQIIAGSRVLLDGNDWLPRALMEQLLANWRKTQRPQMQSNRPALTSREREILNLANQGLSNAEIANQLALSPHTVKSHVHNLLRKIGAANRTEAAFLLREHLDRPKPSASC